MHLTERLAEMLDGTEVTQLNGGFQSEVFKVIRGDGEVLIAKVLDPAAVARAEVERRTDVIAALAALDPAVCCPLLIDGRLVTELAHGDGPGGLVIAYEFAEGRPPDPANVADAEQMGGALAALHASMSRLGPADLPPVYALRTSHARGQGPDWQPHQLLHGDFQSANLRKTSDGLRIFDLEDCGYGPVLFEVANSLYMVLFDSIVQSTPNVYGAFRPAFVAGYVAVSGISLSDAELDRYIDLRVDALAEWLGDLASAPPGIRNASAEWLATLQRFVANYRFPPA